jgi:hypothetical protein
MTWQFKTYNSYNKTCLFLISGNTIKLFEVGCAVIMPFLGTTQVWRYQRSNQKPYMEGQTMQWWKEQGQKVKQWSTKHYIETKDRETQTPLTTDMNSCASEALCKSVTISYMKTTFCYSSNITQVLFNCLFSICTNYGSAIQYSQAYISP